MVEVVNMKHCPDWGKPGDVCIDRTTKWGNPYLIDLGMDRNCVCDLYEKWFVKSNLNIMDLKDVKRLGCHCKPKRCHGDYLKKRIEDLDKQVTL
jgi:hypothetical protein